MEDLVKALGPWPMMQGIVIGILVAGVAIWAIKRGLQDSKTGSASLEDAKAKWELYGHIEHICKNSFDILKQMEKSNDILDRLLVAMNRFNDSRWNDRQ